MFWTVSLPEIVIDPVDLILDRQSRAACALSDCADARSVPNGFSTTSRRHAPSVRCSRPTRPSCRRSARRRWAAWQDRTGDCRTSPLSVSSFQKPCSRCRTKLHRIDRLRDRSDAAKQLVGRLPFSRAASHACSIPSSRHLPEVVFRISLADDADNGRNAPAADRIRQDCRVRE